MGNLHENVRTFMAVLFEIFLEYRSCTESQNTRFMFSDCPHPTSPRIVRFLRQGGKVW